MRSSRGPIHCWLLILLASLLAAGARAEVSTGRDADSGRLSWTWAGDGVSIQLVQLLPDQTRAFFIGRGFDRAAADRIGRACVFQTIFRNDGEQAVQYDLSGWTLTHGGERRGLRTREVWAADPETAALDEASRIALRWALLPTVQRFEPGDYNWGMLSAGLPPGERFDLSATLTLGGEPTDVMIPAVQCAEDR